jgi:hypothetical protein
LNLDVVMEGAITSGIIYPARVAKLASTYIAVAVAMQKSFVSCASLTGQRASPWARSMRRWAA